MTRLISYVVRLIAVAVLAVGVALPAVAHYDPVQGRWLERDPAGYVDGQNLFEYTSSFAVHASDPDGLAWHFVEDPTPLIEVPAPSLLSRTELDTIDPNIHYVTLGRWDADWRFIALVILHSSDVNCCQLDIHGELRDRWYWAVNRGAEKEEKWEAGRQAAYWRDLGRGVRAWRWATENWYPCNLMFASADVLNAGSRVNQYQAYVDINSRDMREHPNRLYQRSLAYVTRERDQARQDFEEATVRIREISSANLQSGFRDCCDYLN